MHRLSLNDFEKKTVRIDRYLYALFVAMDANFRLKHKNRKLPDVDLAPGWAYYVEENGYKEYVKARGGEVEVRSPDISITSTYEI